MIYRLRQLAGATPLRRNIGMTLGRQLLAAFAQLLLVVLIARELGPEGNGYYAMAILIPTMLANFLNLGVGPATVYYISRGDFDTHQAMSGNLHLALVVAAAGMVCALPILLVWGEEIFPGIPSSLLYLGLVSFPLTLLLAYLNTILQGLEDFKAFNLTVLVPPYVNLAGVVIALYILPFGVAGAMVAYIIGQLVGLLIVFSLLSRRKPTLALSGNDTLRSGYARRILGYGWKAHLSNILAFVNYRTDIFLVNFFLTPGATGIYVIAVQIAEKLWMLSQAASTVLLPRLSAMHQNPEARLALTNKGFLVVSAITAAASVGVAIALWWLISPLFGEEYVEALPAFLWLLPGIIAGAGARIYSNCIAAADKPEWNMYSSIGVVTINVVGNVLLVPKYGIIGAAWATSISYIFNVVVKFYMVRKTISLQPERESH
ncbi:flippase [Chromohalobacter nigrandesensis]|uniref:flippase n=1 Tax=Chromohalobacter nigrandesensis TaxID=119863 RepID=UPI001FF6A2C8|nr:flippase [Chromohalobacter nigrandesensis]MCK0743688.1 flippase [Chromohalobacter nigrandesensis]